jgi:hypothetical protein
VKQIGCIPVGIIRIIAGVGCLGLAVAAVGAIANAPYRPERYIGGFDPVRAGIAGFLVAAVVLSTLVALAGFGTWRFEADRRALESAVLWAGLAIAADSLAALIVSLPPTSRIVLPIPIGLSLVVGIGLAILGSFPSLHSWAVATGRKRDLSLRVALVLLAAAIVLHIVSRL